MKRKYLDRNFEVKEVQADGSFAGYASVFGDLDSYRDIVLPGAFKKSLGEYKKNGRKVPILWQHDSREPIGTYELIKEDDHGLYVEGQLTKGVSRADDAHLLLKQGALSGISIGYTTKDSDFDSKKEIRYLKEVALWEASLVTFPALDTARVETVKSLSDLMDIGDCEDWLRDAAGLSQKEAKTIISKIKAAGTQRDVGEDERLSKVLNRALSNLSV